jgi:hypothetical protein
MKRPSPYSTAQKTPGANEYCLRMKRKAILVFSVLLIAATGAFAMKGNGLAIGAEVTSTNLTSWGGMLNLHFANVPLHFAIGGYVDGGISGAELKVDYWLLHGNLISGLDWYMGIGGYLGAQLRPASSVSLGVRVPFALQIWPMGERLEIFLELAPAWIPFSNGKTSPSTIGIQPAIGFRIWF